MTKLLSKPEHPMAGQTLAPRRSRWWGGRELQRPPVGVVEVSRQGMEIGLCERALIKALTATKPLSPEKVTRPEEGEAAN